MSGLVLPRHVMVARQRQKDAHALQAAATSSLMRPQKHRISTDDFVSSDEIADQVGDFMEYDGLIPTAAGWSVMVLMITIPEITEGGLIMDSEYTDMRTKASPQGVVLGIGSSAYRKDDQRFSRGPWCKVGDRVLYGRYAGKAFQLANGQELAFLADTDIIATVESGWLDRESSNVSS